MILLCSAKQLSIPFILSMINMITPGVQEVQLSGQIELESRFPAIFQAEEKLEKGIEVVADWFRAHRLTILEQLSESGALLFRGLPVHSYQDFDLVLRSLGQENFSYAESLSNAVRHNRTDRVFTANEAPPEVEIYFHHEMAQTPIFPSKLVFYCEQAPTKGGATPLCRSDALLSEAARRVPEFVKRCDELGLRYTNVMPASADLASGQGRSWRSTLSVDTKEEAAARLAGLRYEFEWLVDDSLKATTPTLPAIRRLPDGRRVFFNQLIAAFKGWQDARNQANKSVCYGDGRALSDEEMKSVCAISEELAFDLHWATGDIALIDNLLVMHGRRPFEGQRCVLASLLA